MSKTKKPPAFKRRRYKLNWRQIYERLLDVQRQLEQSHGGLMLIKLDEAIDAMKERMYS